MTFIYEAGRFYDIPCDIFAIGLRDAIIANPAVFDEVGGEQGIDLPPLTEEKIFVGRFNANEPKLLTIEFSSTAEPESGTLTDLIDLSCIIRAGSEGNPTLQSRRSAGYCHAIRRLVLAMCFTSGLNELLSSWPAPLPGESATARASRIDRYRKRTKIELLNIQSFPSNEAARAAGGGFEGGVRISLSVTGGKR